jgi:hypothetical protein
VCVLSDPGEAVELAQEAECTRARAPGPWSTQQAPGVCGCTSWASILAGTVPWAQVRGSCFAVSDIVSTDAFQFNKLWTQYFDWELVLQREPPLSAEVSFPLPLEGGCLRHTVSVGPGCPRLPPYSPPPFCDGRLRMHAWLPACVCAREVCRMCAGCACVRDVHVCVHVCFLCVCVCVAAVRWLGSKKSVEETAEADFEELAFGNVTRTVHCPARSTSCDPVVVFVANVVTYRTYFLRVRVVPWDDIPVNPVGVAEFRFNFRSSAFAQFELGFRVRWRRFLEAPIPSLHRLFSFSVSGPPRHVRPKL